MGRMRLQSSREAQQSSLTRSALMCKYKRNVIMRESIIRADRETWLEGCYSPFRGTMLPSCSRYNFSGSIAARQCSVSGVGNRPLLNAPGSIVWAYCRSTRFPSSRSMTLEGCGIRYDPHRLECLAPVKASWAPFLSSARIVSRSPACPRDAGDKRTGGCGWQRFNLWKAAVPSLPIVYRSFRHWRGSLLQLSAALAISPNMELEVWRP
jgi:hypothetical protein